MDLDQRPTEGKVFLLKRLFSSIRDVNTFLLAITLG